MQTNANNFIITNELDVFHHKHFEYCSLEKNIFVLQFCVQCKYKQLVFLAGNCTILFMIQHASVLYRTQRKGPRTKVMGCS